MTPEVEVDMNEVGAEQHHGSLHGEVRNDLPSVRPPFARPCADLAPGDGWRKQA